MNINWPPSLRDGNPLDFSLRTLLKDLVCVLPFKLFNKISCQAHKCACKCRYNRYHVKLRGWKLTQNLACNTSIQYIHQGKYYEPKIPSPFLVYILSVKSFLLVYWKLCSVISPEHELRHTFLALRFDLTVSLLWTVSLTPLQIHLWSTGMLVGLGGLVVMCSPRDPRFTGSNLAEVGGFFSRRKNPEQKSSRRDFKLGVPTLKFQAR